MREAHQKDEIVEKAADFVNIGRLSMMFILTVFDISLKYYSMKSFDMKEGKWSTNFIK